MAKTPYTAPVDDAQAIEDYLDSIEKEFDEDQAEENAEPGQSMEPMDDRNLESIVAGQLVDAVRYIDLEIGGARALATSYYRGDPLGDEEEGRSRVISMDVRDTVIVTLPQLMRIFFSSENVVEYAPETPDESQMAGQATDYANYIVQRDNDGFGTVYATFKDALVRKKGFIKYWWDESVEVTTEDYSGLDDDALAMLMQDNQDAELSIVASYPVDGMEPQPDPMTGGMMPPAMQHDVRIKRRTTDGRVCIQSLPPEEFIIDRRARSIKDAVVIAHRSMKTISELVAMGYDEDEMEQFVTSNELDTNIEYITRQPLARAVGGFDSFNPALQRVLYMECYARVDYDGDGIAELRKVCMAGPSYKLLHHEAVDHIPFAVFDCDPEPHAFFGLSQADVTMDIQRIKTHILRGMLDSLAQSISPRMTIVEGQVNVEDVLNNEVGAIIRQRAPGMAQSLETPFVGQSAMPVLDYMDQVRETRTGMSKASMGLDPDALQSTTKAAVAATITASQGQVDLLARILAEGMKQLFKGILYLIVKHQDRPRMVKVRNDWVSMDPRTWNANMDVTVNVALGTGTADQKLMALQTIAAAQKEILMTLGPNNPLVSMAQYANTLRKSVELTGFKDAGQFFNALPADFQMPEPEPKPTPEEILAQAQAQAIQADVAKKAAELQMKEEESLRLDAREREKIAQDGQLRQLELELKYQADINDAAVQLEIAKQSESIRKAAQLEQAMVNSLTPPAPPPPAEPMLPPEMPPQM